MTLPAKMSPDWLPDVSVVTAVHNGERYLPESLESIFNQSFHNFELIVVDDGSTDSTPSILEAYHCDKLTILRICTREGQAKARNRALDTAVGRYIALHDADDISLPNRIATQFAFLEGNPTIGVVGTGREYIGPDGDVKGESLAPHHDTELRWRLLFGTTFCHPSLMFRRSLVEEHHIRYRLDPPVEDYDFVVQLSHKSRLANIDKPLYRYRLHEASTTSRSVGFLEQTTAQVSAMQIQPYLPDRHISPEVAASLRRCYFGKLREREDVLNGKLMLRLFATFAQRPGIDPHIIDTVREEWVKRFIAGIPLRYLRTFLSSGLPAALARDFPLSAGTGLVKLGTGHIIRRVGSRA